MLSVLPLQQKCKVVQNRLGIQKSPILKALAGWQTPDPLLLKTSCFLEEKQRQMTRSMVTDSSPQVLCSSLEPCWAKSFLNPQANPIIANPPLGPSCWPWLYDFICHFCSAHGNLLLSMINDKILSHSSVIFIFPWCWPLLLGALRTPWKIHLSLLTRFYGTQEERHDVIDNWR